MSFQVGDQVAYIPFHAGGDINHPDVEYGFVTSTTLDCVFCRYWRRGMRGVLRTTANSECTDPARLVRKVTAPQEHVDSLLATFGHKEAA